MELTKFYIYLSFLLIVLFSNYCALSKQIVLVLETSESQAENSNAPTSEASTVASVAPEVLPALDSKSQRSLVDASATNTRIVTDDSSPLVFNESSNTEQHKLHKPSNHSQAQHHDHQQQHHTTAAPPQTRHKEPSTSTRRQTEESHQKQPATSSQQVAPSRPIVVKQDSGAPKNEERLLISISSSDDDEDSPDANKPSKQLNVGGSGSSHELSGDGYSSSSASPPKRKPSITISIQNGNIKQNDGSSPSAVIVRPSQNGQSIVISTVGVNGESTSGGKHQIISANGPDGSHNKPSISIIPSSGSTLTSSNDPPPYREPVNNPIISSSGGGSHHAHSSTRRPTSLVNDNNNPRPISSTLIDSQKPNQDERPSRPISSTLDDGYETSSSRPSLKPVFIRPTETQFDPQIDKEESGLKPVNNPPADQQVNMYPLNEKNCGSLQETRIVGGDEANPDDFLWMAAIIKSKPKDGDAKPFCGGSLITRRHILTAAHCLENLAPRDVLVRLGSYDFDDATASSLSADYAIDQFRVPAQYSKKTHAADIAIMRLKTPLSTNDNYKTVCMPQARRSYVGAMGTVTGYGSQSQTFRRAAPKLRQVTVPIWENRKCAGVYKKNMTESFLCAGFEEGGKDACQGDSGGPLMTEGPNDKMMIVGVVSHGIGCGSPGYPGVYTRTTTYLDWIEKNTKE